MALRHWRSWSAAAPRPESTALSPRPRSKRSTAVLRAIGIYDGYRDLAAGGTPKTVELTFDHVSRIHTSGGSILRTSRTNPGQRRSDARALRRSLDALGLRYLVCIGGDDTTYGAAKIAERTRGRIGVATVPKTIDNDLPLPDNAPTFGFETARSVGAGILESLMEDARTTARWYVVVCMGRKSGSLALGCAKPPARRSRFCPRSFAEKTTLASVVDTIVGAIVKRRSLGREHGVAVVAEGIAERIGDDVVQLEGESRARFVRPRSARRRSARHHPARRRAQAARARSASTRRAREGHRLRTALREAGPVRRRLHAHARLRRGSLPGRRRQRRADRLGGGRVTPITLEDLLDPKTGRIRTRQVDLTTEAYRVARDYMVRLEPPDFSDPARVAALPRRRISTRRVSRSVRIRRYVAPITEKEARRCATRLSLEKIWHRPTFEGPCGPTIIGAGGLNCRVRDGNGWDPAAMGARNLIPTAMASRSSSRSRRETCKAVQRRTSSVTRALA